MSQNTFIGALVLILLAVGGWYFFNSKNAPVVPLVPDAQSATSSVTTAPDTSATATTTKPTAVALKPKVVTPPAFKSLFTESGSHLCTYQQVTATSQSRTNIYVAGGKMRGEYSLTSGGITSSNLMIYDHGYLYSWNEGKTTGIKTPITSVSQIPVRVPQDLTSGAVLGTSVDNVSWDCHPWIMNAGMLTIPSYVTFAR